MKNTIRRMISIGLSCAVLIGSVPVFAGTATSQDVARELVSLYQDASASERTEFVEMMEVLEQAQDIDKVADVYGEAISKLGNGKDVAEGNYGATSEAIKALAGYMKGKNEENVDNLVKYLEDGDTDAIVTALESTQFQDVLDESGITSTHIENSAKKVGNMLNLVNIAEAFKFQAVTYNTKTSEFALNSEFDKVYDLVDDYITSTDSKQMQEALNVFVREVNTLSSKDQELLRSYLKGNGLLKEYTPSDSSSGGGGSSSPSKPKESDEKKSDSAQAIDKIASEVKDAASANKASAKAQEVIADAVKDLSNMKPEEVQKAVEDLVKSSAALVQQLDAVSKADSMAVKAQIANLVEKAVAQVAKTEVKAVDGKVTLPADKVKENIKKAQELKKALVKSMKDNGLEATKDIPVALAFDVTMEEGAKEVAVELPEALLSELSGDVKVQLNTGLASFTLDKDTFKGGAATVSVKSVEVEGYSNVLDFTATTEFAKPIEVAVPYTLGANEKPELVTMFLLGEDGTVVPVGGVYDEVTGEVKCVLAHFSKYFVKVAAPKNFEDLSKAPWAKDYITTLAAKGYIGGVSATKYDPQANITRAQFATLVVNLMKIEDESAVAPFADVKADAWYYSAVASAYEAGLIGGKSADKFEPNAPISREEMAKLVAKVLEIKGYAPGTADGASDFADNANIAAWAKPFVSAAYREGIISGKDGNKFDPKGNATRAEAAKILYNLLNK